MKHRVTTFLAAGILAVALAVPAFPQGTGVGGTNFNNVVLDALDTGGGTRCAQSFLVMRYTDATSQAAYLYMWFGSDGLMRHASPGAFGPASVSPGTAALKVRLIPCVDMDDTSGPLSRD